MLKKVKKERGSLFLQAFNLTSNVGMLVSLFVWAKSCN